jgi:NTP pyrophosphatase (non-canonical NTP hydrolase)
MELNEYQFKAKKTVTDTVDGRAEYFALGLCGESGEVAEKIKKMLRDDNFIDIAGLQKELGDVLWYLSQLSLCFGLDLEGIAKMNLKKLEDRKNRGVISGSGDDR